MKTKLKIGDIVWFWKDTDDSAMASDCFGVEPQNDWFDVQYYPENVKGIVTRTKGRIEVQHIYTTANGGTGTGKTYGISKSCIQDRILCVENRIADYNLTIRQFAECAEAETLDFFYDVELVNPE